jgi:hypothetical protein
MMVTRLNKLYNMFRQVPPFRSDINYMYQVSIFYQPFIIKITVS